MMAKVRLADIAAEVGVSTVTVHNALTGNKGVSEDVREQIQRVAEELGYQPVSVTKRSKKEEEPQEEFNTIGVLIAENYLAEYTTFYWKMYQELALMATEKRCFIAVEVLKKEDEMRTYRLPVSVEEKKIDGLIVIGEIDKKYIRKLRLYTGIPVVFLDFYDKEIANDAVVADNFYGMYLLTEFLFEQGITELAYVGSVYATSSIMDRYCGFMKSMMMHGKTLPPEWLIEDRDREGQIDFQLPENLPRGFVCNCDLVASMVIEKLRDRGYKVPEDVAVVGFDNYLYPGLPDLKITTYEVNMKAMSRVALEKVLKQMKSSKRGRRLDIVSGAMVVKQTVKITAHEDKGA